MATSEFESALGPKVPRDQRLRDPVHGLIAFRANEPVDQLAWRLIDTLEFQRLKRIKQLGVSEFVFSSATHTRFAHSIGVFHTARTLIEIIKREIKEDFRPDRAEVAVIAALLHDLGHGPFSHTFEGVQKARGLDKQHEQWSAQIVREGPSVAPLLAAYRSDFRIDDRLGDDIATMLEAEDPIDLYHAVVSSSFDADRLDYLRRDRLMTGTQAGAIDFDWLLEHVRVREVAIEAADPEENEELILVKTFCLDEKARPAAEQFLMARYTLHEQVYFHKTTRCVEYMIAKLLRRVSDLVGSDAECCKQVGLAESHPVVRFFGTKDPSLNDYLALDDVTILAALEPMSCASDAEIADIASRLRERRLYKVLDLNKFGHDEGRQISRARGIDKAIAERSFQGEVYKDENAKIGIYTQIGGDEERTHKKLHVLDAGKPREITELSLLIRALKDKQQFTRYFFANESDKETAKNIRRPHR